MGGPGERRNGSEAIGEREGQLVDPFGHRWGLTQHVRDVPLDEKTAIAAQVFAPAPDA
jgi:PhnB protein